MCSSRDITAWRTQKPAWDASEIGRGYSRHCLLAVSGNKFYLLPINVYLLRSRNVYFVHTASLSPAVVVICIVFSRSMAIVEHCSCVCMRFAPVGMNAEPTHAMRIALRRWWTFCAWEMFSSYLHARNRLYL